MFPSTARRRNRTNWENPLDLLRDFDQILNSPEWTGDAPAASYPVDIEEDENNVYVEAEMPGFSKDEIEVTLENGVLSISAERQQHSSGEGEPGRRSHLHERRYTRVARRFALPTTLDESDVQAKLDNGVLRLTIPKKEEVRPRRIEVS